MKQIKFYMLVVCVIFGFALTGCNTNNSSGNSRLNDYTEEQENVTNNAIEKEKAVKKVVFNSTLDVHNYLEGK